MQKSTLQIRVRKDGSDQPSAPFDRPRSNSSHSIIRDFERPLPKVPGYEVLAELGRGGMGVVYKAKQIELDRIVALKMVLASEYADTKQLQRFLIEAETLAAVHHPNIIQIHAIGAHDGRPFLALEYVAGGSLAAKLDGSPRCPFDAAECIATLALAVHHAHRQGIVHRDLKPSNVLLKPDAANPDSLGIPKLGDFGLAKRLHANMDLTHSGTVLGTPAYMAPEQATGEARDANPTSDVYSLGAILYELLTGQPPFKAAGAFDAMLQAKQRDPTPPGKIRRKLPRDLEIICLKALDKDTKRRYQSAADLAEDLRRFLHEEPIQARSVSALGRAVRWSKRNVGYASLISAFSLTIVAAFAAISMQWHRATELHREALAGRAAAENAEREAKFSEANAILERGSHLCDSGDVAHGLVWLSRASTLVSEHTPLRQSLDRILSGWARRLPAPSSIFKGKGPIAHAVYRPDGSSVAVAYRSGEIAVWPVDKGPSEPFQLPIMASPLLRLRHAEGATCIAYSSDGRLLASGADDGSACVWDADTGAPVGKAIRIAHRVRCVAFSPGSNHLAVSGHDGTAGVWNFRTGDAVTLLPKQKEPIREIAFRPDGKMLGTACDDYNAALWRLPSGEQVPADMAHGGSVRRAVFSPDSRWFVTAGNGDAAMIWNAETGAPAGKPILFRNSVAAIAFHPGGKSLFIGSEDRVGRMFDVSGAVPSQKFEFRCSDGFEYAEFSRDGRFLLTGSDGGSAQVWDASNGALLSGDLLVQQEVSAVAFAPDGRSVMTATDDGVVRIWRVPALERNAASIESPASPAVGFGEGPKCRLFSCTDGVWIQPKGEPLRKVSFGDPARRATCQAVSVDGGWAAKAFDDRSIHVWTPSDGASIGRRLNGTLFHEVDTIDLSADGRLLLAGGTSRIDAGIGAAAVYNVADGTLVAELKGHRRVVSSAALSPDGRFAATSSGDGKLRFWSIAPRVERLSDITHPDLPTCVVFSPDGRYVATGCGDRFVRIWDFAAGRLAIPPIPQHAAVAEVVFSLDGRLFAAGATDGSVQLFDVAAGRSVGPSEKLSQCIHSLAFSADGASLIAGDAASPPLSWRIPTTPNVSSAHLRRWIEIAAGLEAEPIQGVAPLSREEWSRRLEAAIAARRDG